MIAIFSRIRLNRKQVISVILFTMAATIAHRLSTIQDASAILYMENGDIKEVGDHDTLMKLNGKYAALYNSQFA